MKPLRTLPVAAMLTVFTAACDRPSDVPGEFTGLPHEGWQYGTVLKFNAEGDTLPDSTNRVGISVRHTNDYPYANLWIEVAYATADTVVADTFNLALADEYGKWLGSGSGPSIQHTRTVELTHRPAPGASFDVRHIMRVDRIEEIEQIGLTFVNK